MRIRDRDYIQKLIATIAAVTGTAPVDLDEEQILGVLDLSHFLPATEMIAQPVTISGQPIDIVGGGGGSDETGTGELFTSDPNDTTNQTQDLTQTAGGAGVFSKAGFSVKARLVIPTRLELVYFALRPSVDCQIEVARSTTAAGFAGKNLIDATASARSGVTDRSQTSGTKRQVDSRFWVPFHAANTIFEWPLTAPSFRIAPASIPDGFDVLCIADVANTAIRVQWGVIWRQVPTP